MTQEQLDVLKLQEDTLQFKEFDSARALVLGNAVAELADEYQRSISVCIVREQDHVTLFQYVMNGQSQRNLDFMEAKRKAARFAGHCSLWPYVEHDLTGAWQDLFDHVPEYLPVAGAFPIRVNQQWVATLMISGLHEGKDHELAVRALSKVLQVDVPQFSGAAM